jgi:hypothetical protein
MRSVGLVFASLMIAAITSEAACTAPAYTAGANANSNASSSSKKKKSSSKDSTKATGDDDDDDSAAAAAPSAGNPDDGTAPRASRFACTGAGVAAYADALVAAGRQSCNSQGTGVVRNNNYQCVKTAIDSVAPPHPDQSYQIVTTLLAPNQQYPNLECTYFIQMVTAGVCGTPLSPNNMAWTDYPLAHEFINKAPAGWTWFMNNGTGQVQAGDIFVYDTSGGQDPGHIMIVAEVMNGGQFRIAEANELNADGTPATGETGVVSNTRVTSLNDPEQRPAGWFRLNPQ